jgi:DNA-binding PadR family transcriptional regulator
MNGRKRKYYSIKKDGHEALKEKREQWIVGFCSAVNASTLFQLNATERLWWPPVVATIVLFFGSCLYFNRTLRVQTPLEN